jgi:hypothetical protein
MDAFWLVPALSQEQGAIAGYASAVDFDIIALVSIMIFVYYGVHCSLKISIAWFESAGEKRSFDTGTKNPVLTIPCHRFIHRLPAISHNGNGYRVAGFFPGMMPITFIIVVFCTGTSPRSSQD